jgi:cholesterol transport system auxiliary component
MTHFNTSRLFYISRLFNTSRLGTSRLGRLFVSSLLISLMAGCAALRPSVPPPLSFYSLDNARITANTATRPAAASLASSLTLTVNPAHAASGFNSQHMIYTREAHQLEHFAHSQWIDTPARMLAPLIVSAIENSGTFRAVILSPSHASSDLRLDSEIVRLQQEFDTQPSRVRFTLRAYVIENKSRRVLAVREFDASVAVASEETYAGVVAANRAVHTVLEQLASFCSEASRSWQAPDSNR